MNENVYPKEKQRKLRQTKLIFGQNRQMIIDSNTSKSDIKMAANKKIKKEKPNVDKCVALSFESVVDLTAEPFCGQPSVEPVTNEPSFESDVSVDSRLDVTEGNDLVDNEISVIFDKNQTVLPLEMALDLMDDCNDNNPVVIALKTIDELKEECSSLGLTLDTNACDHKSDDVSEPSGSAPIYEVESIYDSKDGSYFVKWKNYSEKSNTWEPFTNLTNCLKLVDEFNYIRTNGDSNQMEIYRNYHKLKGLIEDVVERKMPFDVMTAVLLVFNDIRLKDFNHSKTSINRMRSDFRDRHLSEMDSIAEIKNREKRVEKMTNRYNKLIDDLNIVKRFDSFDKFYEFFVKRKQIEFQLNRWQNAVNDIIVREREGQPIKLENLVDCEVPPHNFEYISFCRTLDPNITISDEPPVYCECNDCETNPNECCIATYQSPIVYTKNGILKDSRNSRTVYECNKKCKCNENCINRVVQNGRKHRLAIFKTDDDKGWGVRALERIPKGSYVMEYVGEIISVDEADRRGQIYDAEGRTYLFDLDFTPEEVAQYTLDATQCGNVSHFVNHSCDPNLDTRVVWINNLDPFMPHIALFAVRDIKLNEELTFDYKISDADESNQNIPKDSTIDSDKSFDSGIQGSNSEPKVTRVSCRCGADNCRKYLY